MSDDIVARLREGTRTPYGLPVQSDEASLHVAAADEIARLRADLAAARELLNEARICIHGWDPDMCARIDIFLKGSDDEN